MLLAAVAVSAILALVAGVFVGHWAPWRRAVGSRDARYRAMLEQSPNGVVIADVHSLQVLDANLSAQRALGYTLPEMQALKLPQLFSDEGPDSGGLAARLSRQDARTALQLRLRQLCKNGNAQDIEATAHQWLLDGRMLLALQTSEVSIRRKIEAQLLEKQQHLDHLAHHDQLTGLPNRLYLAHHLPLAIEEAKRANLMLAVLFLDLDRFKHINDSRGHETGDKLLKTVAERVRDTVRKEDVVVRMGGDEFIVILKDIKRIETINEMAARINSALSVPVVVDERPLSTSVSIGVSLFPRDGTNMGELLRHSDTAMYQAKDRGRNNFQLFSPGMARKLRERVAIEASLRAALERGQLDVHYQPIVEISSRKVMWLEALLRWKHPHQGSILPGRFIDIAEETGLIVPIGEFVLRRVMEDLRGWRAANLTPVPVAINVSAVQLQRSNIADTIIALTRELEINPNLLQIELTETAMFERRESRDGNSRRDTLSQLRELGVGIAIDDFGTGYSSLSYLKQWHVDYLKIDRSFVRDLVTDMSDLAIVGAIIAMARHLKIKVVAEGIEGWQQFEKLRQLGCSLAQGYLFAKPTPSAQCHRFLTGQTLDLTAEANQEIEQSDQFKMTGMFRALGL